eukprot:CAMPEP_0168772542 /NCGR_PEP_ID=MMETSP0725-20121227/4010_1 /TAXON_ID=265536 /ORGANISM="Amphiprora sp., Strain CCMP467" /LENGTH=378 /DNA_ID=CAMNT_0008822063 /DNA_START=8 /DNA_END=1144 /DNA_ORIENTATION=-
MALASVPSSSPSSSPSSWRSLDEASASRAILYDMPVSNNGARVRLILYKKGLGSQDVTMVKPTEVGGLKSDDYLQINPQGKMPSMVCKDTGLNLAESDTIARFILSKHATVGPSFQPDNPKSNLMSRLHDIYLGPIQGCLYKAKGPFGIFGTRKDAIAEYVRQMQIIDGLIDGSQEGLYLCGSEVSLADATLFPSMVFANFMLPKFDVSPPLPSKIARWFREVRERDSAFAKVYSEIVEALEAWDENGRWQNILGAGLRDTEPATLFDKIVAGDIPAAIVEETDKVLAFKDIKPSSPAHVLVIPKDRNGLTRLTKASDEHTEILGELMVVAAKVARNTELGFGDGARFVVNDGPDGGQEIMHLHVHVLGGRSMQWPPG